MLTPPSYRPVRRRRLSAAPGARRFGRDFRSECKYRSPSWTAEHLSAWSKRSRGSERRCKIRLRLEVGNCCPSTEGSKHHEGKDVHPSLVHGGVSSCINDDNDCSSVRQDRACGRQALDRLLG